MPCYVKSLLDIREHGSHQHVIVEIQGDVIPCPTTLCCDVICFLGSMFSFPFSILSVLPSLTTFTCPMKIKKAFLGREMRMCIKMVGGSNDRLI
jgi:hypothetical protein